MHIPRKMYNNQSKSSNTLKYVIVKIMKRKRKERNRERERERRIERENMLKATKGNTDITFGHLGGSVG